MLLPAAVAEREREGGREADAVSQSLPSGSAELETGEGGGPKEEKNRGKKREVTRGEKASPPAPPASVVVVKRPTRDEEGKASLGVIVRETDKREERDATVHL